MSPFAVRMSPITVRVSVNVGIRYFKSFLGFIKPSPHRIPISSEIAPRQKNRVPAVVARPTLSAFPAAPSGPPNSIRKSPHPAAFAGVIGGDINRIRVSHGFSSFGGASTVWFSFSAMLPSRYLPSSIKALQNCSGLQESNAHFWWSVCEL